MGPQIFSKIDLRSGYWQIPDSCLMTWLRQRFALATAILSG